MPSRRPAGGGGTSAGSGTSRRKHSLGNLRRAHPASGATWNVQVVRGKMSSKCLWHACRALILGLSLMLLGAGMATIGYYADHLAIGTEVRGNATIRVKNDLKGFHLNNFAYVGPIVMGFGGFIVVASCVMTFEARDSAAKVVPARLRAGTTGGTSKTTTRSNQSSSASQRRGMQAPRWDHHFGVFRSSPADPNVPAAPLAAPPLDRDALTAELIKFSKSLSASARFSPQLRRLTYTGSVPNLSTHSPHPVSYSTNVSHLFSPNHKSLLMHPNKRNHHHHHYHHHHHATIAAAAAAAAAINNNNNNQRNHHQRHHRNSGRHSKSRGTRISNSLVQRATREHTMCSLLQPPLPPTNRMFWHAASFDESAEAQLSRNTERNRRSDTAKRHVLSRQKPIDFEEDKSASRDFVGGGGGGGSPLGHRRSSTMSDSSYTGGGVRCPSLASRGSSIDSRRVQVDLHSPDIMPKSILRSPKRYGGPSSTPSVEKDFRSQLSVCSEPPPVTIRQLSGQSSFGPCFPEETAVEAAEAAAHEPSNANRTTPRSRSVTPSPPPPPAAAEQTNPPDAQSITPLQSPKDVTPNKRPRPDSLPICTAAGATALKMTRNEFGKISLQRSHSSRTFYRPKPQIPKESDDSIFYIKSQSNATSATGRDGDANDLYDSLQVINERRSTLLKADSESMLSERKLSSFSLTMQKIPETSQNTSVDIEEGSCTVGVEVDLDVDEGQRETTLQME